ncbi:Crp/Fnr family transcriptional regulator [Phaeodactylibacter sp.]|uniref:Crp/Fnr family transcriptional regulator n=1 Tax=Phaeodactylibacter sp. TaxID=1940289 RepID=UPI0025D7AB1B|nr:Crp/Fnr family transcriptional regulator [Phaeodactylibacter sp.]MCI4648039.1 Crp/Fnr family transcriptional regulator [Phaeodactylibacter sp.]MCI5091078.1 Crp/Fnr family transcriptional regulator [Phaeodactylibacter sp.]
MLLLTCTAYYGKPARLGTKKSRFRMIDFQKLKQLYKLGRDLSFSDIQDLLKNSKAVSFAPGELLIKEGQLRKEVFWVRKGLVRGFRVTEKGEEITTMFRWEDQAFASPNLILFDEPALQYFETLEPTEVFKIDYDKVQTIIKNNPKLEANRVIILQNTLKEALQRIDSFLLLSPEERYLDFIRTNPDISNRVPNKYLANVLGITPVSLSRIRKRVASKKS